MPEHEFRDVLKRNWVPVQLMGCAIPEWAQGIPKSVLAYVCASGVENMPENENYSSSLIPSGTLIGGIDIYRKAPDDPVELNKDWYAVVRCKDDPVMLLVDGPIKDGEHWLNHLPERLLKIEILGVPKLNS